MLEGSNALAPWLVLIAVGMYGAVHSFLASLTAKSLSGRWLGQWGRRGYRLAYNIFAVLSFLPVLWLIVWLPDTEIYRIAFPWTLLTYSLQILGVLVLLFGLLQTDVWSFIGLRQVHSATEPKRNQLVTSGLYRWVRHPLYTAGLLFIWFIPVMTTNLLAFNFSLTIYILVGAVFEERKLVLEYGDAYLQYQQVIPMLIPGSKGKFTWRKGKG
jgi:methanethiol S-methyltransferase